jgi:FkbM family methyltransferase
MDLILKDFGEHKMYLLPKDSGISKTLKKPGGYANREIEFMTIMREEVKPGFVAFDIGANLGFTALVMAQCVGPTGKVLAAEPVKTNFRVLKKNVSVNDYDGRIEAFRMAFSDKTGEEKFYESNRSNLGGFNSKISHVKSYMVPVTTVDAFLAERDVVPDFYKMDVEGHEIQILTGMMETLRASKSAGILMEVHPTLYKKPRQMDKVLRDVFDTGFTPKYVVSAAVACPDLFKEKGYEPIRVYQTSGWERGVFVNVDPEDAIRFTCYPHKQYSKKRGKYSQKIVRSVYLEKK